MDRPRSLFNLFSSFQTHITILQQINVKNYPSSIWCRDSNSQPSEHESPPITTRPGLSPYSFDFCWVGGGDANHNASLRWWKFFAWQNADYVLRYYLVRLYVKWTDFGLVLLIGRYWRWQWKVKQDLSAH